MNRNKMLDAYCCLLNHAKSSLTAAEQKTWQGLGLAVEKTQQCDHDLDRLSCEEFAQVQKDVHGDLMQAAEYLAEADQSVESFVCMELHVLEEILIDKALTLSDPTSITLLRLRLAAAMDENHPLFSKSDKQS